MENANPTGLSEFKRLRMDFERVASEDRMRGVFEWLLEVATWAQIGYRILRIWRLSLLDVAPLRYFAEKALEALTHIHLPSRTPIGGGLRIYHGYGLIINGKSEIGENVTLYARVVIGERYPGDDCPTLGDGVTVGTGAAIFGPIFVQPKTKVKAGMIVTRKCISQLE